MQTSQISESKVEHLQCQPYTMYGFEHWTWIRCSIYIPCERTIDRSIVFEAQLCCELNSKMIYKSVSERLCLIGGSVADRSHFFFYFVLFLVSNCFVAFSAVTGRFSTYLVLYICPHHSRMRCWFFQKHVACSKLLLLLLWFLIYFHWLSECLCQSFMQHMRANRWTHNAKTGPKQCHTFSHLLSVCQKCSTNTQIWNIRFLILFHWK